MISSNKLSTSLKQVNPSPTLSLSLNIFWSKIVKYIHQDFHSQHCICAGSKEDNTGKKEDEDINEDKEVEVVLVAAKYLNQDGIAEGDRDTDDDNAGDCTVGLKTQNGWAENGLDWKLWCWQGRSGTSCLLLRLDCLQRPSVPCIMVFLSFVEVYFSLPQKVLQVNSTCSLHTTWFSFSPWLNVFPLSGFPRDGNAAAHVYRAVKCQMHRNQLSVYNLLFTAVFSLSDLIH